MRSLTLSKGVVTVFAAAPALAPPKNNDSSLGTKPTRARGCLSSLLRLGCSFAISCAPTSGILFLSAKLSAGFFFLEKKICYRCMIDQLKIAMSKLKENQEPHRCIILGTKSYIANYDLHSSSFYCIKVNLHKNKIYTTH
jgi:hypothetical protein